MSNKIKLDDTTKKHVRNLLASVCKAKFEGINGIEIMATSDSIKYLGALITPENKAPASGQKAKKLEVVKREKGKK